MSNDDRSKELGALWAKEEDKDKWNDLEYLDSLPNPYEGPAKEAAENDLEKKKKKTYVDMKADRWASKVILDEIKRCLLIFASRGRKRTIMISGGSELGTRFLNMFPAKEDLRTGFIDFVKGQKSIVKITGSLPPPPKKARKPRKGKADLPGDLYPQYNRGTKAKQLDAVRPKLVEALNKATHGRWAVGNGWPGSSTVEQLNSLGVKMRVKRNNLLVTPNNFCHKLDRLKRGELQRLLVAVEEGWFELIGPDVDSVEVLDASDTYQHLDQGSSQRSKSTKSGTKRRRPSTSSTATGGADGKPNKKPCCAKTKAAVSKRKYKSKAVISSSEEEEDKSDTSEEEEEEPDESSSDESNHTSVFTPHGKASEWVVESEPEEDGSEDQD
ncbi:hypothetical protein PtB15_16B136 [Puccinia triticina]|nr:hypothetical protein PtB15_16B136 [Puccinia triticina]